MRPFAELQLDETRLPKEQVRAFVRELVLDGRLVPGTRIPSTESLSQLWKTHVPAVHAALASLVKEGLLARHHGRGTYVRKREARLARVGLYYTEQFFPPAGSAFIQSVHTALKELLGAAGIETEIWVDPRTVIAQARPWPPLVEAARQRKIQAVVVPMTDWPHIRWISKLPIPSASFTTANLPNMVTTNLRQVAELSLRALRAQGCRSAGLIFPNSPDVFASAGGSDPHAYLAFYEHFTNLSCDLGIRVRNEWMLTQARGCRGRTPEELGYELFLKLWRQREHPRGLVVYTDAHARGVIAAILQRQVRVPEELRLVCHRNVEVGLFCPLPATFVDFSARQVAEALITQVRKQFQGEPCQPIILSPSLAASETKPLP